MTSPQPRSRSPTWRRADASGCCLSASSLLLGAYGSVVLWLDLPLWVLRLASIAIPFITGLIYFGIRPRLIAFDIAVVVAFAIFPSRP